MSTGGLESQIAIELGQKPKMATEQAKLLDDLARALKETADAASSIRPEPSRLELEARQRMPASGMPQVLKSMAARNGYDIGKHETPWSFQLPIDIDWAKVKAVLMSPVAVSFGVGALAIVVVLSAVQIVTSPGMIEPAQVRAAVGVQTLVALNNSVRNPDVVMHSIATEDSKDAAGAEPVLNAEESVLLSRSGVLIRQGNLQGARTMLARAASDGSTAARFALAETFDPFKLTAWGVDRVAADPAVAMRLYEQVLAAGDERAAGRIAALSQVR